MHATDSKYLEYGDEGVNNVLNFSMINCIKPT